MKTRDNFVVAFTEHTQAYCNFRTKTAHTCISTAEYTHAQPLSFQLFWVLLHFSQTVGMWWKCVKQQWQKGSVRLKTLREREREGTTVGLSWRFTIINCSDNMDWRFYKWLFHQIGILESNSSCSQIVQSQSLCRNRSLSQVVIWEIIFWYGYGYVPYLNRLRADIISFVEAICKFLRIVPNYNVQYNMLIGNRRKCSYTKLVILLKMSAYGSLFYQNLINIRNSCKAHRTGGTDKWCSSNHLTYLGTHLSDDALKQ